MRELTEASIQEQVVLRKRAEERLEERRELETLRKDKDRFKEREKELEAVRAERAEFEVEMEQRFSDFQRQISSRSLMIEDSGSASSISGSGSVGNGSGSNSNSSSRSGSPEPDKSDEGRGSGKKKRRVERLAEVRKCEIDVRRTRVLQHDALTPFQHHGHLWLLRLGSLVAAVADVASLELSSSTYVPAGITIINFLRTASRRGGMEGGRFVVLAWC